MKIDSLITLMKPYKSIFGYFKYFVWMESSFQALSLGVKTRF